MQLLDVSFSAPAENLACDEALLEELEQGGGQPTLRFWESARTFVVVGYANRIATEVKVMACAKRGLPVLRRSSGGGTVVQGPGCLNYNITLPIGAETANITDTNCFVMRRNRDALRTLLGPNVEIRGHTDLALGELKFSGNAQRRKSRALVFHGCFLLNFDLQLIDDLLLHPTREPDYRGARRHRDFVTNISLPADQVKAAIAKTWGANETRSAPDFSALVRERYTNPEWNEKF